ncbi:MAG: M55 family metallopeptidase [Halofilum sp. (in: g-proteobacteria)]
MRVFISVDMEGTTGLERLEEIFRGLPGFDTFRQLMAGDANAVIQGAIEGGATEIVVSDSHGYMCNIHPDDLIAKNVQLRRGQLRRGWCQMKGFDHSFDAFLMIGFHAKAGTTDAILSHTWITGFRDVRINGHSVPEPSLNALLAGSFGVPTVMLSGDDRVIGEASPVLGDDPIYTQLKKSLGFSKGDHLPIDQSRKLLRENARKAVQNAPKVKPVTCELPVTIEVDLSADARNDPALAARVDDNVRFVDGPWRGDLALSDFEHVMRNHPDVTSPKDGTVAITAGGYPEAYRKLHAILGEIYERDIENLIDIAADPTGYERSDLENIVGTDYPLNEIGTRR